MRLPLLVTLLLAVGCAHEAPAAARHAAPATASKPGREPPPMRGVVDAHNAVRAKHNLPPMSWSPGAAAVAQAWANQCRWGHNPNNGERGENIAAYTGDPSPLQSVALWAGEAKDYDSAHNACRPGAQCGHYTQLVWAKTTRVGCAMTTCDFLGAGTTFVVCDYEPPGNYIGERPY